MMDAEQISTVEGKKPVVFVSDAMVFEQATVVSGKETVVFGLEATQIVAHTVVEGIIAIVPAAKTAVEGIKIIVSTVKAAVEETNSTASFLGRASFFLEAAAIIPQTGVCMIPMGTRISLNAVHGTETMVFGIKADAREIDTGPIGAETALQAAFHPQRIREEPVRRCATAERRCRAGASAPATDVALRPLHGSSRANGVSFICPHQSMNPRNL